jgi:hypothetical protein
VQADEHRIFDWLGSDSQGVSYHLHPLNLAWSPEGMEHDLAIYRGVADRLAQDIDYWSFIIRNPNWRHSLVGCVCLLATKRRQHLEDLRFRFEGCSMVLPQIAVTMGLLHPSEARAAFELVLDTPKLRENPRRLVSAEKALICLGARPESKVTLSGWKDFDRDDAILADRVVKDHWTFWSSRV